MRIVDVPQMETLFVIWRDQLPHHLEPIDEGTGVDVGPNGELLGLVVEAPWRDWTGPLERILEAYPVSEEDAEVLRAAAAPDRSAA